MRAPDVYKQAMKSYRYWFVIGAFTGVVICLVVAKLIIILPVLLALLFGAIAFERKIKQNGNSK